MSDSACAACFDAGADFDWCRVCGRGRSLEKQESAATRVAEGHPTELERMILATHPPNCSCKHHSGKR